MDKSIIAFKQDGPVAIFMENLVGGGVEKTCLKLTKGLHDRVVQVDLLLCSLKGELAPLIPEDINIVNFSKSRMLATFFPLMRYIRRNKPAAIIAFDSHVNVVTLMAKLLGRNNTTRFILSEQINISTNTKNSFKGRIILSFMRWLYPKADVIVGVSNGVSRDLEKCLGLEKNSVKTIYNGIIDDGFFERANEPLEHEWFQPGMSPVLMAAGRFVEQKDFTNLLRAFALLREKRLAKLMLLGEGPLRSRLEKQIQELGLGDDTCMPGFILNPLRYFKKCSAFVLSSRLEGLPSVVLEALACGCPVVSTDCPSGPAEILDHGKYGHLVPVGDSRALAEAMGKALDSPPDPAPLIQRAKQFSVDKAVSNYLSVL